MKICFFHLMPYRFLPDDFERAYRSVWLDVPHSLYDPARTHGLYNEFLDELEFAERMGFDGLCVNEHHNNAYGLMPSPNLMAAALTRRTSRAALDALDLERPHLAGHFFGAMVAAELAALMPRRVGRLVLVSPLGLWRDDAPGADVLILPASELQAVLWRDPDGEVARQWAAFPENDAENVAAQIESIQRRAAMGKFVWPIPDKGITRRLHRIAAPTLVLWGDADRANPVVYAEAWQRRIKGAALQIVSGGHMVIHEAPDACAAAVERFLA